ncbi:hypothetical protein JQC67_00790 [Aurantibacter crassamenti]|uniref:hypothetical protein n=1 Tax=Aurantibacter crassamenti TaxID=1837375 RepID=UPI00193A9B3E|nr:hypothetical protein [Aurantibacter crassamenti]MBM1104661.1 hypothetical protein [Aurantibacter crassamenti]
MSSKLLFVFAVLICFQFGTAQEKNKYNPYAQPKKWKKEEERLKQVREAAKGNLKVWELTDHGDHKLYEVDGYRARFTPNSSRRAPKEFIALVSSNKGEKYSPLDLFIEYRGACEQQMTVKTLSIMYTNPIVQKFLETRDINDLPVVGMLNAMKKGLRDQCDDLESIRFSLSPIYVPPKDGTGKNQKVEYNGHMNKNTGWQLTAGFDDALDNFVLKLYTPPGPNSMLAVKYEGACNATQKLHIAPVFSNNTERYAYQKEKTLYGYEEVAKRAIQQYVLECPTAEEFVFSLDYLPEPMFIREDKEGVIRASKKDNWKLDVSDFGYFRSEGPKINDYEDILTLLENKDFPFIDRYSDFFKLFYEDFMDVYGTTCRSNLTNPTKISIHAFESRYNSEGYKISESEIGPPQVSYVETAYLKRYQNYSYYNKGTVLYNVFRGFFSGNTQNGVDAILFRVRGQQHIRKYINNNCNGEELKAVYDYMQELTAEIK